MFRLCSSAWSNSSNDFKQLVIDGLEAYLGRRDDVIRSRAISILSTGKLK